VIVDSTTDPVKPLPSGSYSGDRPSTNFLRLVSLEFGGLPTTGQIGVRLGF
jgi:hypothetical protein